MYCALESFLEISLGVHITTVDPFFAIYMGFYGISSRIIKLGVWVHVGKMVGCVPHPKQGCLYIAQSFKFHLVFQQFLFVFHFIMIYKLYLLKVKKYSGNFISQDLKDRNDELTAELETMKQFPALKKKCSTTGRSPRGFGSRIPVLEGSLLSDYIRAGRRGVRSSLSSGRYPWGLGWYLLLTL